MKMKISAVGCTAIKNAAAMAKSRVVSPEDGAVYISADANNNTGYVRVLTEGGLTYEHTFDAEVDESGCASVPGSVLRNVFGFYAEPELTLTKSGKLRIKSGVKGGGYVDLPVYATVTKPPERALAKISLNAKALATALADISFAVLPEVHAIGGNVMTAAARITIKDGVCTTEGCQNHFGGRCSFPAPGQGELDITIPHELMAKTIALLKGCNGDAVLAYDGHTVSVIFEGMVLTSRRFIGQYFRTEVLYNTGAGMTCLALDATVAKEVMAKALAVTSVKELGFAKLNLTIPPAGSSDGIAIEYSMPMGIIKDNIGCEVKEGCEVPQRFCLNPRLGAGVFNGLGSDAIVYIVGNSRPMICEAQFDKDGVTFKQRRILAGMKPDNTN